MCRKFVYMSECLTRTSYIVWVMLITTPMGGGVIKKTQFVWQYTPQIVLLKEKAILKGTNLLSFSTCAYTWCPLAENVRLEGLYYCHWCPLNFSRSISSTLEATFYLHGFTFIPAWISDYIYHGMYVRWKYSIPKLPRLQRWSLGID